MGFPSNLTLGGLNVPRGLLADSFASHFHSKVITNAVRTKVNSSVYNGKCQLIVQNRNFMKINDVKDCLNDLSSKQCEGLVDPRWSSGLIRHVLDRG